MKRRAYLACAVVALGVGSPRVARAEVETDFDWTKIVRIAGYVQPQLVWQLYNSTGSPNANASGVLPSGIGANDVIAQRDGTTTNQDFFRLRRARLRFDVTPDDWARFTFEIEPFHKGGLIPANGSAARTVEAAGIARLSGDVLLEIAAGQFNVPFGGEVIEANSLRPFIDSSFASGALFPGDFDVGARAVLTVGRVTVMSSILNGNMLGEPTFAALPDLNKGKDFTLRALYDFGSLVVGASGYIGRGQRVDSARVRFKSYERWASNAEATFDRIIAPTLGHTKVLGAVTYATNMDRGLFYSFALPDIPNDVTQPVVDQHELGWFVRAEQDCSRWVTVGVRYDAYTPNLSVADNQRRTIAGVAVVHFTTQLQLMLEYDDAFDRVHAPATQPIARQNQTLSSVLQARF